MATDCILSKRGCRRGLQVMDGEWQGRGSKKGQILGQGAGRGTLA